MACFWYHYFFVSSSSNLWWRNWVMTEEKLQSTADRLWMSKEDLKKEIAGWKTVKQIMQEKGMNFGGRTGSGKTRKMNQ
jgi:hypothetical protein